MQSRNLTRAE
jgi:hypothetical protein